MSPLIEESVGIGMTAKAASPLYEAVIAACEAESLLGQVISELTDRLSGVLRPDDRCVPSDGYIVSENSAPYVTQLQHHTGALRSQASRLRELIDRLDV